VLGFRILMFGERLLVFMTSKSVLFVTFVVSLLSVNLDYV
jgi:hypothetical protein